MQAKFVNHYDVLGVERTATKEEIDAARTTRMLAERPLTRLEEAQARATAQGETLSIEDLIKIMQSAEQVVLEILQAWSVLDNGKKRRNFDQKLAAHEAALNGEVAIPAVPPSPVPALKL